MSDFYPGDRVIYVEDYREDLFGEEGRVKQEWCEYGDHVIGVYFDNGDYAEASLDCFEHVEDPYEYASTWDNHEGGFWDVFESEWGTREEAEAEAVCASEIGNMGVKVVKRRKAGPVLDVDTKEG